MNNKINNLHTKWIANPTVQNLTELLDEVRRRVIQRYCTFDSNCEDIAQEVVLKVWRALMGDLAQYDPKRGSFAAYCATVARSTRKDMLKHERLTATKDISLHLLIEENEQDINDETGY